MNVNECFKKNIKAVAASKKMLLSALEKSLSVSPGYFSRDSSKVSLQTAYDAAILLDTDLACLCTEGLWKQIEIEAIDKKIGELETAKRKLQEEQ